MKYFYLVMLVLSSLVAVIAVWHDDWAKASFFSLVNIVETEFVLEENRRAFLIATND